MLCDVDVSCICTHGRCHVMLTSLALTHMVRAARCRPNVFSSAAWPAVSPEIGPRFPQHGAGNRGSISGKTPPPEIGAQFGPRVGGTEPATFRLQGSVPPTRPKSGGQRGHTSSLLHSHRLRPRPDQIPNPNSKRAVWILEFGFWSLDFGVWSLEFGFWILDLGFWILEFGFWSLDFGFWISLVFVLFVAAPNGAVWILDFGFGLGLPCIVCILHKIFPCHADSGRRIIIIIVCVIQLVLHCLIPNWIVILFRCCLFCFAHSVSLQMYQTCFVMISPWKRAHGK